MKKAILISAVLLLGAGLCANHSGSAASWLIGRIPGCVGGQVSGTVSFVKNLFSAIF